MSEKQRTENKSKVKNQKSKIKRDVRDGRLWAIGYRGAGI